MKVLVNMEAFCKHLNCHQLLVLYWSMVYWSKYFVANVCIKYKIRYSTEPRHQIFIKGFGFLSLAKNISKTVSKNLSSK